MREDDASAERVTGVRTDQPPFRAVAALLERWAGDIECGYAFGSHARGLAGPLSDLDIAILFRESLGAQARLDLAAAAVEEVER